MVEVEACVEVADDHGRTAPGDRVRLRDMNLRHVPLETRQRVTPRLGCRRRRTRFELLLQLRSKPCGVRDTFDPVVLAELVSERGAGRAGDRHADPVVALTEDASGALDRARGVGRDGCALVEDDLRAGRVGAGRRRGPRHSSYDGHRYQRDAHAHSLATHISPSVEVVFDVALPRRLRTEPDLRATIIRCRNTSFPSWIPANA
jgi:hypothetical protein